MSSSYSEDQKKYWKSIGDFHNEPEVEKIKFEEFLPSTVDNVELSDLPPISRRKFLALLSASAAFATAGCTNYKDKGEIVPYNKLPEEIRIGTANYYASTCTACSQNCGTLVKTREGRPIRIDGNPDHPVNKGKICNKGQADILNLFDPNRLRSPLLSTGSGSFDEISWESVDQSIIAKLKEVSARGKEIALITHTITSPTSEKVLETFSKTYPTAKVYSYELFSEQARRLSWKKCYGSTTYPLINWDDAKIILSLEADLLSTDGEILEQIRSITGNRNVNRSGQFNRIWVAEAGFSLTGMFADYQLRIKPDLQLEFVLSLLNEIVFRRKSSLVSLNPEVTRVLESHSLPAFAQKQKLSLDTLNLLVTDLLNNKEKGIVYPGKSLSEKAHVATLLLNEVLGNTKLYKKDVARVTYLNETSTKEWTNFLTRVNENKVGMIIHIDTNPVYHLSPEHRYKESLSKVGTVVTFSQRENETAFRSSYILPLHHAMESWGDFKTRTGAHSLQQPVIAPLYSTRQWETTLLHWADGRQTQPKETLYHEYLKALWEKEVYPALDLNVDFKRFWYSALHDGVVERKEKISLNNRFIIKPEWIEASPQQPEKFTLLLRENQHIADGRFAGNGWLQEIPHPVSKIVWDNYAAISPKTANDLKVSNDDNLVIRVDEKELVVPAFIQPGMADNVVTLELGYGRTHAGIIGSNVGFNAGIFLASGSAESPYYSHPEVRKGNGKHKLVSTQEHHSLDDSFVKDLHIKRKIIQEGTLAQFQADPEFIKRQHHELINITKEVEYPGVKWGMAIDLNKCIGCTACVSSCIAENNIPVVGKEQVELGREMHWIRIDRYYSGTPEEPIVSNQPMLCQHCDHAPCENVCPVAATNHSEDGLNQMAYNRCVGTRYCSNNCPYKVRRFNFLDFRETLADGFFTQEPLSALQNPEVTVRSRGVMEKCTFCIQRIMDARQHAIEQEKELKGSDVVTACQQACPSDAIVFGDMNDPESIISANRNHLLSYHVLEELNVRPNVTYLAKLRNKHSERAS